MERTVSKWFERWARMVARRPWPVLLLALAVVGFFAAQIPNIVVDTSTEGFLHSSDPILVAYDDFRERFGRDDSVILGIETGDPFSLDFLERLRAFHADLENTTPFVDEITSMLNARWTRGELDQLLVEDLITEWPANEADLAELRRRVYANPLYLDNLINRDGHITTVLIDADTYVQTGVDDTGTPVQRYLTGEEHREIVEAIRMVIERHEGEGFKVHAVGVIWMADRLAYRLLQDLPQLVRKALLVMAVILFALFGSIRGVILPLLVVISAALVTFGALPLLDMPYQLPTQVVALSLLAVGIGDSIHVLAMYYHFKREGRERVDALADAFAHAGAAILTTSLTTAGALLSFLWSELAPISNLGVLLPIGVMAALVATITILPALILILPEPKRAPKQRSFVFIEQGVRKAGLWAADRPRIALGGAAVVLAVSLAGASQVKFAHNPLLWFPEGNTFRESTLLLNERLGGIVTLEILLGTGEPGAVKNPELLAAIDDMASFNAEYRSDSDTLKVGKTISIVDLLKETNRALNGNRDSSYALPDNRELIAQELLLFELSGSNDLEDLTDYEYQTARMTIRVPWVDATRYGAFSDGLLDAYRARAGELADIEITGRVSLLSRTITAVIQSMSVSYVIAFAAVMPMMMLFLGSARLGLVAMVPNLLPIVAALGLMGLLAIPLDMFSLLTGSITLGVAVDDTIHFMHGVRRELTRGSNIRDAIEHTLTVTGQALFSTSLILCCGFGLYATAYMGNLANFGFVTAFALAVALLADIILGPALVSVLGSRLMRRQQP